MFRCLGILFFVILLPLESRSQGLKQTPSGPLGDWTVVRDIDPITDAVRLVAVSRATGAMPGTQPMMALRCIGDEFSIAISWTEFLGREETLPVTVRYGSQKAQEATWLITDNGRIISPTTNPAELLVRLLISDRFVIQIESSRVIGVRTAVFNLRGLVDVILPLREQCRV